MFHSLVVYGAISMIQKVRPKDFQTDLLFVGTEKQRYFTLEWNPTTKRLEEVQVLEDRGEKHMRDSQSQDKCLVDPSGRYLCLHLWEGVLSIFRLPNRKSTIANNTRSLLLMDQIRLSELFIKASTFLYTETGHPKVAFLYQSDTETQSAKIATYRLTSDDRDVQASAFNAVKDRDLSVDYSDPGANLLIPVRKVEEEQKRHHVRNPTHAKAHLGGFIIVGETRMQYVDDLTKATVEMALPEATIFVAWAEYDETQYFLADDYGNMHWLTLVCDGVVVQSITVDKLGTTSRASNLVYLGYELLFVASHYGDSQLFKLGDLQTENPLELVQTLESIAPIVDFAVMDMGNREGEGDGKVGSAYSSGQARIVTGSGVYNDGSLRSVRSGVGLDDVGILADLEDVRGLYGLRSYGSGSLDTLVVSFVTETRVFKFDSEGGVEEVASFNNFMFSRQTLLATNLPDGRLLQVTTGGAVLVNPESGAIISQWSPDAAQMVTNASCNEMWLILAVDGTSLITFDVHNLSLSRQIEVANNDQVACVHAQPGSNDVGVVGFWRGTVSIVNMSSLEPTHHASLRKSEDEASIPRDLALVQVLPSNVSGPTLFVAMEDGNVITYKITDAESGLTGRKTVVLGTRQASFHLLPQPTGLYNIFAASEHASLIHASEGRIVYSAVTAQDAVCVCPFDTEAYPGCIALATGSQVKIAQIDEERRTHVTSLPMGEIVRRLAYSPGEKLFGIGCIKRSVVRGEEIIKSSFKLVDEVVFGRLGKEYELNAPDGNPEIIEAVTRAELPDAYGNPAERFIIGTSYLANDGSTPFVNNYQGRILVLGVDSDRNPYVIMSRELKGACRCIEVMGNDKIVTALTKSVIVSQYREASNTSAELHRLASYRPATNPVDMSVEGNIIAVGDLMKSITLVEYIPGENGENPQLVQRARHPQAAWVTAVSHIDGHSWLEADANGNLTVLSRNLKAVTEEQRQRLEMTSEMNLGEMVNKIRKVSVETTPNAVMAPKAFLVTVSPDALPRASLQTEESFTDNVK
jgi:DNA damage-binding protein 1